MSPRPRETSDEEILAATGRVMQKYSPTQLTLAHVAKEAGVVPATLIQRFGTKRNLLLAACRTAPAGVRQQFDAARAKYKSPLKTLLELYAACSSFASTPESMANGLAYLQNDLTDPEFRAIDSICDLVRNAGNRAALVGLDSLAERARVRTRES